MNTGSKQKSTRPVTRSVTGKTDASSLLLSIFKALCSGVSLSKLLLFLLILASLIASIWMLPLEQLLKRFLIWLKEDVGPWGPVIMALSYIPLTILAVPASVLTLGGGYVFGLAVGFIADSLGSTLGATAAFIVGKTIGRSYVSGKLKDFPQFQSISGAIGKSGFKIVLLLRLVPILPFNIMNYLLAVTPISVWSFALASWIGMMPITFVFVYIGTTIKDLSEIGSTDKKMDPNYWWMIGAGFIVTGIAMYFITQTAKDILHKTLEAHETEKEDDVLVDEERPNFRGSVPEIKSAAVFKPLLNDSKDGHKL